MEEKCLIAATIAFLACHPSTTIRCFKPQPQGTKSKEKDKLKTSSQKHKPKPKPKPKTTSPPKSLTPNAKQTPLKSKEKLIPNFSFFSNGTSSQKHKPKPKPESTAPKSLTPNAKQTHLKSKEKLKPHSCFSLNKTSTQGLVNKVSEVFKRDPLFGVIERIIRSGWLDEASLKIKKVLRVSHTARTLFVYEQFRQSLEVQHSKSSGGFNERLAVDGNEILQFHGATVSCSFGENLNGLSSNICEKKLCGLCRILASNFSMEDRSVSFFKNSWEAHEKVIANGVCARKAIIVCRVIAGRIGHCDQHGIMDEEEGGFDSIVIGSSGNQSNGGEELFVLDPRAVLPCFVVTYSV